MDTHDDVNRKRSPRRLRLQFGLRSMMIVVLLICLALGRHVERVRRQRQAVAELTEAGASISYHLSGADPYAAGTAAIEKPRTLAEWIEWSTPVRLRAALGIDFFRHVERVDFGVGDAVDYAPTLRRLRDLPGLRRLTLNCAVDEDLAFAATVGTLTYLDVGYDSTITDAGLAHLARLHRLEHLELPYNPISDAGLAHLAGLRRLKHLDLSATSIGDAGASHLAEMLELEFLDIDRTKVTDDGMLHLARLRGMKHLDLSSTAIGDAGFSIVAKLPDLEYLNASETQITDKGLAALRPLASLNELDLARTAITDKGLRIVGDLGSLERVSIDATAATTEGAAWLRERQPNTTVVFHDAHQKLGPIADLRVLMKAGLWRKALEAMGTFPKPVLDEPFVQLELARCHAELACWDKAEFEYRAALERGLSPWTRSGLSLWTRSNDKVWPEILAWPELFERVARGFPNDATRWEASARRAVVEGRWSAAADDYARAVECLQNLDPAVGDEMGGRTIELQYGASQILAGDLPEFRRACDRLAKAHQRGVEKNAKLGIPFNYHLDFPEFLQLIAPQGTFDALQTENWSKAVAAPPSDSPGWLSLMYCRMGEFEKVFEQERPSGQLGDDDCGRFWFSRAMAHQHLGRPAQARECFTRGTQWLGRRMKIARLRGDYYVAGDLLEAEALRREAKRLIFE